MQASGERSMCTHRTCSYRARLSQPLACSSRSCQSALTVLSSGQYWARARPHLGTAFQLTDDVLDYSGQEADTGKHIGDDLAEGKPTLPLIYVMQHGTPEQAACVRKAIEEGGRDDFPVVLAAIRESGALQHALKRAGEEADLAIAAISSLRDSNFKKALLQLPRFAVERNH